MAKDHQEKKHLAAKHDVFTTKVVHMITAENKKRLWKLLQKFFSKKQLSKSHLQELYQYIDQGFTDEYFHDRSTPPLPAHEPSTNLLRIQLHKLLDESEATSPTVKPSEENPLSCKCDEAGPNIPSFSKTQVGLKGSTVAVATEDEDIPHTSESETSSDSSSGDASE